MAVVARKLSAHEDEDVIALELLDGLIDPAVLIRSYYFVHKILIY